MPIARSRRVKTSPYAPSLSRMRKAGAVSHGKASVIWRASQSAVGLVVTPIQRIFLRPRPRTTKANKCLRSSSAATSASPAFPTNAASCGSGMCPTVCPQQSSKFVFVQYIEVQYIGRDCPLTLTPITDELLTTEQAAAAYGLSQSTLRKWRCVGTGPHFMVAAALHRFEALIWQKRSR